LCDLGDPVSLGLVTSSMNVSFPTDRLFFACLRAKPKNTASKFYFSIDEELVYLK
jgi:hypothetical protein